VGGWMDEGTALELCGTENLKSKSISNSSLKEAHCIVLINSEAHKSGKC
jgi:hypothetical protein